MSLANSPRARHPLEQVRWDDLEVFAMIAEGVRLGKNLQQIAEDPASGAGGPRMLYFRLRRLETSLGRRLVDRRPWGRTARVTKEGAEVARTTTELLATRGRLRDAFRAPESPVLRVATHATLISTIIPAAIAARPGRTGVSLRAHLEVILVAAYEEALADVHDGRADLGIYLVFPEFTAAHVPRNVLPRVLTRTDVVLLVPASHRLAEQSAGRRSATVRLDDLLDEQVVIRGPVDQRLLPLGARGRRIVVSHSLDKIAYVRLGLGLALYPRLAAELLPLPPEIRMVTLRPLIWAELTLLKPRKYVRPSTQAAEEFLEGLRTCVTQWTRRERRGAS